MKHKAPGCSRDVRCFSTRVAEVPAPPLRPHRASYSIDTKGGCHPLPPGCCPGIGLGPCSAWCAGSDGSMAGMLLPMPWPPSMAISSCTGVLPCMPVCFSLQRQAGRPESCTGSPCDRSACRVSCGAAFAHAVSSRRGAHAHRMQYSQAAQQAAVRRPPRCGLHTMDRYGLSIRQLAAYLACSSSPDTPFCRDPSMGSSMPADKHIWSRRSSRVLMEPRQQLAIHVSPAKPSCQR